MLLCLVGPDEPVIVRTYLDRLIIRILYLKKLHEFFKSRASFRIDIPTTVALENKARLYHVING